MRCTSSSGKINLQTNERTNKRNSRIGEQQKATWPTVNQPTQAVDHMLSSYQSTKYYHHQNLSPNKSSSRQSKKSWETEKKKKKKNGGVFFEHWKVPLQVNMDTDNYHHHRWRRTQATLALGKARKLNSGASSVLLYHHYNNNNNSTSSLHFTSHKPILEDIASLADPKVFSSAWAWARACTSSSSVAICLDHHWCGGISALAHTLNRENHRMFRCVCVL